MTSKEDSEPRIARIRENLNDGIGPFEVMSEIIVGSQHGPNNAGLFGIMQSPIKPLRPSLPSSSSSATTTTTTTTTTATSSSSVLPTSVPRLTAKQMAQSMQNIVDEPLPTIQTSLHIKKNQEKKNNNSRTVAGSSNDKPSSNGNVPSRTRKRKRSDHSDTSTNHWQKPCTSGGAVKVDTNDSKMTMNELFGEENGIGGKRRFISSSKEIRKDVEKKIMVQETEKHESPDSGIAEDVNDSNRQQAADRPRMRVGELIDELSQVSPLITPPREPQKPTLPVALSLSSIHEKEQERIIAFYKSAMRKLAAPNFVITPPSQPTSWNNWKPCSSCDSQASVSERPVMPPRSLSRNAIADSCNNVATNSKRQNACSAATTPSYGVRDPKKPIHTHFCQTWKNNKSEMSANRNDLKMKFQKKLVKQRDKTYVATASSSSPNSIISTTAIISNTKEKEKRRKKNNNQTATSSNNEQLPCTSSKNDKKCMQSKFSSSQHDDELFEEETPNEKGKKEEEEEHFREKEKLLMMKDSLRVKNSVRLNEQSEESREPKKKLTNGLDRSMNNSNNNNNNENDNSIDKAAIVQSSKYDEDIVSLAKKCKKDNNADKNLVINGTDKNLIADGTSPINTSDPDPGSGNFACQRARFIPLAKTKLEMNEDGTYKSATYYLDEVARPLRQKADNEGGDFVRRTLAHMEAVAYFILSAAVEKENKQRQYSIIRDSAENIKTIMKWPGAVTGELAPFDYHFFHRLKRLSMRIQSVLNYYLFSLKDAACMSNFGALVKYESRLMALDAAAMRIDGVASANSQNGSAANTT